MKKGWEKGHSVSLMKMSGCLAREEEEGRRMWRDKTGRRKRRDREEVRMEGVSLFDQL